MKRLLSMMLALVLLFGTVPMSASADGEALGMPDIAEGASYVEMITSASMVDVIKVMEGFSAEPYADVSQWSIGYGSYCGDIDDPKPEITWTEEEAAEELKRLLKEEYGAKLNEYCESIGKQPTQQQFDALVSFTYNLGASWMNGNYRLTRWLEAPSTELELVNAMGSWARVSGDISYNICCRRLREAIIFLKGEYSLPYSDSEIPSALPVVFNADLPYYKVVIFQAGEGLMESYSDSVRYYTEGEPYGEFETASYEGHEFVSWTVTRVNNTATDSGRILTTEDIVEDHLEITANWVEVPEPTDPTEEPTEPTEEPTEPTEEPTEPTEESTDPTEEPTNPTEEPTEPTEESTNPTEEPTHPTEEPTNPTEEPTEPTEEPTDPTEESTEPTEESTDPTEEPTEPTEEPTDPTEEPTEPTDPTEEPTEPTEEPTEPTEEPTEPEDSELPFTDVQPRHWFYKDVKFVYENGYMVGQSDTEFDPNGSMTRGMLVAVLYRIDGRPEVSDEDREYFSDTQNSWYTDAVGWAYANGIVSGVSETRFAPNDKVTRQDAVSIFYRYCVNYLGIDLGERADLSGFADEHRVSAYAYEPMAWAVEVGLVAGNADGGELYLEPKANLTRAQGAALLNRCVNKIFTMV